MPFLIFFPIIIGVGVVIASIAASRQSEQKKRQEAQSRAAAEQQASVSAPPQTKPLTPVQPSVQTPKSAFDAERTPAARANAPQSAAQAGQRQSQQMPRVKPQPKPLQMHPDDDHCALRPDDPKAQNPEEHLDHDLCALRPDEPEAQEAASAAQGNTDLLAFTPDNILRGVVFSEIFGKPKAMQ